MKKKNEMLRGGGKERKEKKSDKNNKARKDKKLYKKWSEILQDLEHNFTKSPPPQYFFYCNRCNHRPKINKIFFSLLGFDKTVILS